MANKSDRVLRTGKNAKAGLYLQERSVAMVGDQRHFVVADNRGITIRGPISIVATSESIRKGGLFVGLNDYIEMIPSTIISPLPRNVYMPPIHLIKNVVQDVAFFMAMLV